MLSYQSFTQLHSHVKYKISIGPQAIPNKLDLNESGSDNTLSQTNQSLHHKSVFTFVIKANVHNIDLVFCQQTLL